VIASCENRDAHGPVSVRGEAFAELEEQAFVVGVRQRDERASDAPRADLGAADGADEFGSRAARGRHLAAHGRPAGAPDGRGRARRSMPTNSTDAATAVMKSDVATIRTRTKLREAAVLGDRVALTVCVSVSRWIASSGPISPRNSSSKLDRARSRRAPSGTA